MKRNLVLMPLIFYVFYLIPSACGTFSIVAYDPVMEEWGVAVQSKFLAVGAAVPFAKAGIGAVATQAWGNTTYGPEGLKLLMLGIAPDKVLEILTEKDEYREHRQAGMVDARGRSAAFTGSKCHAWAGHVTGDGFAVQGNILAGEAVVKDMADAYLHVEGPLAERLLAALKAGQAAGGDSRGRQSAALLVVREQGGYSGYDDRMIDLRVDDHPQPIEELERIYRLHEKTFLGSAYARVAFVYFDAGKKDAGKTALNRALDLTRKYPAEAPLLNQLAWEMAIRDFNLEQALDLAKRAVDLAPEDANVWDTLGEIYARLGDYDRAVEAERKAVELSTDENRALFMEKLHTWQSKAKGVKSALDS
ncbi:DUF1028 domain-containing protein [bacterium]|nr:DUF1028 domain-containing protein [candidate division CSSED10-310 bacterium]